MDGLTEEQKEIAAAHTAYLHEILAGLGWYQYSWRLPFVRSSDFDEIKSWCTEEFGPELNDKNHRTATWMVVDLSGMHDMEFCFKTDSMAIMFRLRWGGEEGLWGDAIHSRKKP